LSLVGSKLPKKTDFDWWNERAELLKGTQNEIGKKFLRTNRVYEVGPWAIMKLALLGYYVQVYTNILGSSGTINYVDLFAGPGINRIKGTDLKIMGSPLLAELAPRKHHFTNLILCELDKKNADALKILLPDARVINDDINAGGLNQLIQLLESSRGHSLVFADPEGLELHFETLERIFDVTYCDVLINYQPNAVNRVLGQVARNPEMKRSLTDFFGTTDWKNDGDGDQLLDIYCAQIRKFRDNVKAVKVQGTRLFHYYIILATRKVKRAGRDLGQEEWLKSFERVKQRVERTDARQAKTFLEIVTGSQATFESEEEFYHMN